MDRPMKWDHPSGRVFIPLSHTLIKRVVCLRRLCIRAEEILIKAVSNFLLYTVILQLLLLELSLLYLF